MQDRNLKRTVILTTLTTLLIGAGNATVAQDSSTYTLAPTADAYVQDGAYANSNFGGQGYLAVKTSSMGYNRDSFVRFDLTGVAGVESARLRFLASVDKSASIEVAIYASAAGWDEAAMTWNTRPERGQELGRFTVSSTAAAWHEINIEDYVNAEIAAGRTAIGVELHNPKKSSAIVKAHSREATTGKPELVYTTNTAGV